MQWGIISMIIVLAVTFKHGVTPFPWLAYLDNVVHFIRNNVFTVDSAPREVFVIGILLEWHLGR